MRRRPPTVMKIVTWNCCQKFEQKAERIFARSPDIAVIQECSKRSTEMLLFGDGYLAHWRGDNPNKGLGVFYRREWDVRPRQRSDSKSAEAKWIVPFDVHGPESFTLIAVWACAIDGNYHAGYVGQIHKALKHHPEWFSTGPVVMAGDFNSNAVWDRKRGAENHSSMVEALGRHGLVSAYHCSLSQEHGAEQHPTFHLYRHADKPYHLDYIFVPLSWQNRLSVEVGSHADWARLSDHYPLSMTLSPKLR
ncbi:MAG TPA: endonuclease/exonuclease/phosphatase family protein [Edaphobacter sp.]